MADIFNFSQGERIEHTVVNIVNWILDAGYENILVGIANKYNNVEYA